MRATAVAFLVLAVFGGLAATGIAAAEPAGHPPRKYLRVPSIDDLTKAYPDHALRNRIGGTAKIACAVLENGFLSDCVVVDEAPSGEGFGQMALQLSSLFQLSPQSAADIRREGVKDTINMHFSPGPPGI